MSDTQASVLDWMLRFESRLRYKYTEACGCVSPALAISYHLGKRLAALKFIPSIPHVRFRLDCGKLFFHLKLVILRNDSSFMWYGWKFLLLWPRSGYKEASYSKPWRLSSSDSIAYVCSRDWNYCQRYHRIILWCSCSVYLGFGEDQQENGIYWLAHSSKYNFMCILSQSN